MPLRRSFTVPLAGILVLSRMIVCARLSMKGMQPSEHFDDGKPFLISGFSIRSSSCCEHVEVCFVVTVVAGEAGLASRAETTPVMKRHRDGDWRQSS